MNFTQIHKLHTKHILIGLQILILFTVLCSWFLHRGNAYNKVFSLDEYILQDTVVVSEDVTTDEIMGQSGVFLSTPKLRLEKGIYQVLINYNADRMGNRISVSCGLGSMECFAPPLELDPAVHSALMTFEITRRTDDVSIEAFFSGSGYFSITNMAVAETGGRYKKNIFYAFLVCILLDFIYVFSRSDTPHRQLLLALSGIFLAACYPLYTDFLTVGHDIPFHLLRIEAISEGLSHGTFPVKLHPLWAKGHGYAVGIFYGDAFLYFPAFLRLLGFSIQSAYKYFVALIHLGTVLISYCSFREMFSSRKVGLLGCLAYTLAPYRLADVYTRASVGEYTALMFMPLVLWGFYFIFKSTSEKVPWKYIIISAFGLTGLIQSHVLSCLMVVFVLVLSCLVWIRRIWNRYVFSGLIFTAVLTLLLNLNFIVPFLDFSRENIQIYSPDWTGRTAGSFQSNGLFPIQLFTLFQRSNGGAWAAAAGIHNEPTFGIGIFLTIGILLFLYLLLIHHQDIKKGSHYAAALFCMAVGALLLYMCTCFFSWDAIASLNPVFENVIYSLQFPWRMLAPATVLLTFVLCHAFDMAGKILPKYFSLLLTGSLILFGVNCGWYFYDFAFTQEPYRIYNTSELNTMTMYSYDYLPAGTDPEAIDGSLLRLEGIDSLDSYQKTGTDITCTVFAGSEGGYVEFPLLYYKYYRCMDMDTSEEFPACAGNNNVVHVEFPGGYSGRIEVGFREPWFWRLAEWISGLTLAGTIFFYGINKAKATREKLEVSK